MRTRLLLALLAVSVALVACGDDDSVFNLSVGDCFDDDPAATEVVQTVATVACAEPHDNEIFFEFSMTDASYPGREATVAAAGERCVGEFEGFVGLSYEQSDLDLSPITPTAESWDRGDRVVYCALYALDRSKLTGSMRGAAR